MKYLGMNEHGTEYWVDHTGYKVQTKKKTYRIPFNEGDNWDDDITSFTFSPFQNCKDLDEFDVIQVDRGNLFNKPRGFISSLFDNRTEITLEDLKDIRKVQSYSTFMSSSGNYDDKEEKDEHIAWGKTLDATRKRIKKYDDLLWGAHEDHLPGIFKIVKPNPSELKRT